MREIEIKAQLKDPAALLAALESAGVTLSPAVTQHDRVYGKPGVDGGTNQHEPWLRIRTETTEGGAETNYFTFKRTVTTQLDSIEHETTIGDVQELEKIIEQLDFVPYSDLTKTRCHGKVGRIEICVDHIDQLGAFIEGEILTDDNADYTAVVAELWDSFTLFGIDKSDEVTSGYDVLMNKHLGKE